MNHGPLVFLGALFALSLSWFGFVAQPQIQLGRASLGTNVATKVDLYPQARPGLAQQGLQAYRSLGCYTCHSQQVRQTGAIFDVVLSKPGTNTVAVVDALRVIRPALSGPEAGRLVVSAPSTVLAGVDRATADKAQRALKVGGAEARVEMVVLGPDIQRGWGVARSVAADYLFDRTVMLGSQRIGPDLANLGMRLPDAAWHFQHLYDPKSVVAKSVMPPYRFLFEERKPGMVGGASAGSSTNAAATVLFNDLGVARIGDREVVATDEARALVAYLLSLRADVPLFERPFAFALPGVSTTNSTPAAGATNGAAGATTNAAATPTTPAATPASKP